MPDIEPQIGLAAMLQAALEKRSALIRGFADEDTNSYRIFNGETDGRSGLTVDQYGTLVIIESFREII